MKKILYLTNIEVPYRVEFFNLLGKQCDLTVMYERRSSFNRDSSWASSVNKEFKCLYLDGKKIGNENSFSLSIFKIINQKWDLVVVGCYNSVVQILAMVMMKLKHIPYVINLDGEPFLEDNFKTKIKLLVLKGAAAYLVAGESAVNSLRKVVGKETLICPYYFSSLTAEEIEKNSLYSTNRDKYVLVVGQYFGYKGMDVAFSAAKKDQSLRYKFVGMGKRTDLFEKDMNGIPSNIEIIPFLNKMELEHEYKQCSMVLLPSRLECWGLVVNEAASFGAPIVSTWGSGAAIEFLANDFPQYLAIPGDADSLLDCIKKCLNSDTIYYSDYLKKRSSEYTIEKSVEAHLKLFDKVC